MQNFTTAWVIPTLNRPNDIERLLKSYLKQNLKPDKVIVIDGSKDFATKEVCSNYKDKVKNLIYQHTNKLGSVTQRITAFEFLDDIDYALFLDDDFELDEHAFAILCSQIKKLPPVTCLELNFKTLAYGSELQKIGSSKIFNIIKKFFLLPHESNEKAILPSGANTWLNEYVLEISDELKEIGWLSGCCMFLPVKTIKNDLSHFLNEELQRFGGYALGEDVYLSVQLAKEGCKFYRVMNAWGIHHKAPAARPNYEKLIAAKVHNYYLINKAQGETTFYKLCYAWSIIGNFILASITGIFTRSLSPISGFFAGLRFL